MRKKNYKILDLVFIFTTLFLAGFLIWQLWPSKIKWFENKKQESQAVETKYLFVNKLTGLPSNNEIEANPKIISIMIDNHPEAYPLSGLNEAEVVYEAPVEGGMTRFMAIYSSAQIVEKVGPVRSARPDYFDWAKEYGIPLYLHCGGSPDALSKLKTERRIVDINEFYNGHYFWRENNREAPHNLYTSSSLWQKIFEQNNVTDVDWQGFNFGKNVTTSPALNIEVKYADNFKITWKYNVSEKVYERYFRDKPMIDSNNKTITASTIIITKNKVTILDELGRRAIYNIGSGDAFIFAEGQVTTGTWKKSKAEFRTRFYDEFGEELSIPPGKIWFMSVPKENEIKIF